MNNKQKAKRSFRASKAWKLFRHKMNVKQKGIDPITLHKLIKGCNLHHRHITANEEEYKNMENEDEYIMLNKKTHDCLHWIFIYWKKDPTILDRIDDELKKWH